MAEFLFGIIISLILGLIFGSFSSMASHRIPLGESLVAKRSHCPKCQHTLGVADLLPLVSWLWLRGKCRYCHTSIPYTYLLHELTLSTLFTLVFLSYGYSFLTPILWGVCVCLVIHIAIDLKYYYLPDTVQLFLLMLGIAYACIMFPTPIYPFLGMALYGSVGILLRVIGYILKKTEALGWGDVKFFAIIGVFLGTNPTYMALFFLTSGIIGIVTALLWKHAGRGHLFPFGPALAAAFLAVLLFGKHLAPYLP